MFSNILKSFRKKSAKIDSGDSSTNVITGDHSSVHITPKETKSPIFHPSLKDVEKYDPKTKQLLSNIKRDYNNSIDCMSSLNTWNSGGHWFIKIWIVVAIATALIIWLF